MSFRHLYESKCTKEQKKQIQRNCLAIQQKIYFFVDLISKFCFDTFPPLSSILRPPSVSLYDWSLAHLHTHDQYTYAVFNTHFFTPELMVAEDLEIKQMR